MIPLWEDLPNHEFYRFLGWSLRLDERRHEASSSWLRRGAIYHSINQPNLKRAKNVSERSDVRAARDRRADPVACDRVPLLAQSASRELLRVLVIVRCERLVAADRDARISTNAGSHRPVALHGRKPLGLRVAACGQRRQPTHLDRRPADAQLRRCSKRQQTR